ncbi:MAG: GIY-YIG nuclease family protein [Bacteroidetes bacterium]|nr:GIY-YIG nuclease family protein [Bacteroidota bacterium]
MPGTHQYYIYIVTNPERTVYYTGVTNDLVQRIIEHWINRGKPQTFAGKYYCCNLLYYEEFRYINDAIAREKEIKGWRREKKLKLIKTINQNLSFLNTSICDGWPPKDNDIPTRI